MSDLVDVITGVLDNVEPLYAKARVLAWEAVRDIVLHADDLEAYREAVRVSEVRYYAEAAGVYIRDWMTGEASGELKIVWLALLAQLNLDDWRRIADMYLPDPDEVSERGGNW